MLVDKYNLAQSPAWLRCRKGT